MSLKKRLDKLEKQAGAKRGGCLIVSENEDGTYDHEGETLTRAELDAWQDTLAPGAVVLILDL